MAMPLRAPVLEYLATGNGLLAQEMELKEGEGYWLLALLQLLLRKGESQRRLLRGDDRQSVRERAFVAFREQKTLEWWKGSGNSQKRMGDADEPRMTIKPNYLTIALTLTKLIQRDSPLVPARESSTHDDDSDELKYR